MQNANAEVHDVPDDAWHTIRITQANTPSTVLHLQRKIIQATFISNTSSSARIIQTAPLPSTQSNQATLHKNIIHPPRSSLPMELLLNRGNRRHAHIQRPSSLLTTSTVKAAVLAAASTPSSASTRPVVRSKLRTWSVVTSISTSGSTLWSHEIAVAAVTLLAVRVRL